MLIPGIITLSFLNKHGACKNQCSKFDDQFPNGLAFTKENIALVQSLNFNTAWFIKKFATKSSRAKYEAEWSSLFLIYTEDYRSLSQKGIWDSNEIKQLYNTYLKVCKACDMKYIWDLARSPGIENTQLVNSSPVVIVK